MFQLVIRKEVKPTDMKISIHIERTDAQCTEMVVTLNIPGLSTDIWLCVSIKARFLFWNKTVKWAIHLV